MLAIIADTETNGKSKNFNINWEHPENWPRITQLAWIVVNLETSKIYSTHDHIIKPDGWTVPTVEELKAAGERNPNFFEENNISTERCEKEGIPLTDVFKFFFSDMMHCEIFVAHNLDFDFNVIMAEMCRYMIDAPKSLVKICTMKTTIELCNIPGRNGPKFPSLKELHNQLFQKDFEGAHDALFDVKATLRCFLKLWKANFYKNLFTQLV